MEIQIITTKKKLTKSLINQMRLAPDEVVKNGTPLGYLVNIVKNQNKSLLILHDKCYYILPTNWTKGEHADNNRGVYRTAGPWSQTKKFKDAAACDAWWFSYRKLLAQADTQIYI